MEIDLLAHMGWEKNRLGLSRVILQDLPENWRKEKESVRPDVSIKGLGLGLN